MPRNALTAAAVVQAAVSIADEQGLDSLTMRRVGELVGVEAMALYRYITGREDLLDAMVDSMMNELFVTMKLSSLTPTSAPAGLAGTARDVRDLALAHPWLVPLMVQRPSPDPSLSPPLSGLACTEAVLAALAQYGLNLAASVRTYRAFCAFLLGHLLLEVRNPVDSPIRRRGLGRAPPNNNLTDYPQLARRATLLTATNYPAEFERSLGNFLGTLTPRTEPSTEP